MGNAFFVDGFAQISSMSWRVIPYQQSNGDAQAYPDAKQVCC
jgi:hypothetical protein